MASAFRFSRHAADTTPVTRQCTRRSCASAGGETASRDARSEKKRNKKKKGSRNLWSSFDGDGRRAAKVARAVYARRNVPSRSSRHLRVHS